MKTRAIIFLLLLFSFEIGYSQEVMIADSVNPSQMKSVQYKIARKGPELYYGDIRIGERELTKILLASNDKTVITLALKMQKTNRIKSIGFVAIPFGVLAVGSFILAGASTSRNNNLMEPAVGFGLVAMPFALTGLICCKSHREYRKDAIKYYNEKY